MTIDLDGLLRAYRAADDKTEQTRTEEQILDRYNVTGALLVLDMSGFSRITREKGIVHFLAMVQEMQDVASEHLTSFNGHVIKFFSDNCFAWFRDPRDALDCAVAMMRAHHDIDEGSGSEPLKVCIGIDHGEFLLIEGGECFGHTVNRACKLGEDIAEAEEILISRRAVEAMGDPEGLQLEERNYSISGIDIHAYNVLY